MRVLIITVRADTGGGPEHIYQFIKNSDKKIEYFIACPDDEPYFKRYENLVGRERILIIPRRKFSILSFFKILSFIKKNKIEIIHSHGKGGGVYSRLLKIFSFKKVIHTFHGLHINDYSPVFKKIYLFIERVFSLLTNKVISVSESEKREILRYKIVKQDKIVVIKNGVKVNEKNHYLSKIMNEKFIILNVNRFNYQKNPELVLKIGERLKSDYEIEFEILVLGNGDDYNKIEEEINKKGLGDNIKLLGNVEDIENYYKRADCFVSTSRWEGLSLAVLEAMSFGIPVIATNVVGNMDLIKHKHNGFLFELDKTNDACKYMEMIYKDKDLRKRISENAFNTVKNEYNLENMVKMTVDLYFEV